MEKVAVKIIRQHCQNLGTLAGLVALLVVTAGGCATPAHTGTRSLGRGPKPLEAGTVRVFGGGGAGVGAVTAAVAGGGVEVQATDWLAVGASGGALGQLNALPPVFAIFSLPLTYGGALDVQTHAQVNPGIDWLAFRLRASAGADAKGPIVVSRRSARDSDATRGPAAAASAGLALEVVAQHFGESPDDVELWWLGGLSHRRFFGLRDSERFTTPTAGAFYTYDFDVEMAGATYAYGEFGMDHSVSDATSVYVLGWGQVGAAGFSPILMAGGQVGLAVRF